MTRVLDEPPKRPRSPRAPAGAESGKRRAAGSSRSDRRRPGAGAPSRGRADPASSPGRRRSPPTDGSRRGRIDLAEVDPRIEARRAEVRLARLARRRRLWLVGSVAVTVVALLYGLTRTALLDVDEVIVTGAVQTLAADIRTASGVRPGEALADLDLDAAGAAVRSLPWIHEATVARRWPGTVAVTVTERVPAAAVVAAQGPPSPGDDRTAPEEVPVTLVDGEGRVLAEVAGVPSGLPLIRGLAPPAPGGVMPAGFQGALALAEALTPGLRSRVVAIDVVAGGELELELRPTGRARIGTVDKLDQKIVSLLTVFGQVELTDLCELDVRVPAAPGLTRKDPCD